jgi:CubicO group peptidase (beta-lactamase class C family)
MSSGLRMVAPQDPEADPENTGLRWDIDGVLPTYPDHIYFYTGAVDAFAYAANLPLQWPPNTVGRYRNSDPLLLGYLVKLAAEKRGEDYHAFPQRELFDRIGIRTMVLETDPYGNFLMNGYELMSARDWARLGNLYLADGVAPDGTRLLPEGFAKFVSTVAPAWAADQRPVYGGMFWINTNAKLLPTDAYFMNGAGGQYTYIVPSRGLVIARLGHFRGERRGLRPAFERAMELLLAAIPK